MENKTQKISSSGTFLQQLRERGLIAQTSHEEELNLKIQQADPATLGTYGVYCGFDPTAPSLHVGNLAALLMLRRAQDVGLKPIVVFGGATGFIGDPTGRTEMRPMNTAEQIAAYVQNFEKLCQRYFRFDVVNKPVFLNNLNWIGPMGWLTFAREVGVHFTVARLLSAEVNKTRLQEGGLTYMELGYQLMQSYDFLHLYRTENCILQFGGDDQWSNLLGGADLIRRVEQGQAFAVTTPLLVDHKGQKFGKSAGNAVWLDSTMTSPYELYQFFRNTHDADVGKILRVFTLRPLQEIEDLEKSLPINDLKAQLAYEVTSLVHGATAADEAKEASLALFATGGSLEHAPTTTLLPLDFEGGLDILALLVRIGFTQSRGEGKRLIEGGGIFLNDEKISDTQQQITKDMVSVGLLVRKGKKSIHRVVV